MNKYMVKAESGKHFGPFTTAAAASKWANKHLKWNKNWVIARLFKA